MSVNRGKTKQDPMGGGGDLGGNALSDFLRWLRSETTMTTTDDDDTSKDLADGERWDARWENAGCKKKGGSGGGGEEEQARRLLLQHNTFSK